MYRLAYYNDTRLKDSYMFTFSTPFADIPSHLSPLTGLATILVGVAKLLLLVPVTCLALLGTLIVVG